MDQSELRCFESFGVTFALRGPSDVADELTALVPTREESRPNDPSDLTFDIRRRDHGDQLLGFEAWRADGSLVERTRAPRDVAKTLANELHFEIASRSESHLFVHAGVVGWHCTAIVLPGRSMSGKTTLVRALLERGATYYSDEYAVVSDDGYVHAYPRPLGVRGDDGRTDAIQPHDLTDRIGSDPLPIGLLAVLRFDEAQGWDVEALSPGAAGLAIVDNTVRARDAAARTLRAAALAGSAQALSGTRGDADDAAERLLQMIG